MSSKVTTVWNYSQPQQLAEALVLIDNSKTMQNFLSDVMTEKEIIEIAARFKAAKMLTNGKPYTQVIAETKLSSRTVARISDWLKNGMGGYRAAFDIVESHHNKHTDPARLS